MLARESTVAQLGLLIVGSVVAAATAHRHFRVARSVLTVTFGSVGSLAG